MTKIALITGITGQDGSYLAELLLDKGYIVHGLRRRSSSVNVDRISHLISDPALSDRFFLHYGDLVDASNLIRLLEKTKPDEVYNLAAQSHVHVSFETPENTANVDAIGPLRLLEAMRILGMHRSGCKFYQASTSELYGKAEEIPQSEVTPFHPRSPYGVAKLYAYWIVRNYQESYGFHVCNGILFNHESPRRGETFVTRKITKAVAEIHLGLAEQLKLGNLNAKRDWGHARDYVRGMWQMMQSSESCEYVLATGVSYSVREFCEMAFMQIGRTLTWEGEGLEEEGIDIETGKVLVSVDPYYFRPAEVDYLLGNAKKASMEIGWKPEIGIEELVAEMVEADLKKLGYKSSIGAQNQRIGVRSLR